jgi:hypothetical protein
MNSADPELAPSHVASHLPSGLHLIPCESTVAKVKLLTSSLVPGPRTITTSRVSGLVRMARCPVPGLKQKPRVTTFGSLISTPRLVASDQMVALTPKSEKTSISSGVLPNSTFAIFPVWLDAPLMATCHCGFETSYACTVSSSAISRRKADEPEPSQPAYTPPFSGPGNHRTCLHRAANSESRTIDRNKLPSVAKRRTRRAWLIEAIIPPCGEAAAT